MKKLLLALLGLFGIAYGQTIGYLRYDSVKMAKPGGYTELILENSTKGVTGGVLTNLGNGRTGFVASSGTGTVTNFSSGSLSPLFTSSVANSTTAPALSFTLSSTSQYKLFGRKVSGSGVPSFIDADSSVIIDLHSEGYYNTKYLNLTTPFNKLTAATGSTSLDNGNTVQTWKWDTHTGTFPGLIISSASTARNNVNAALLGVTISGANASANGYTTGAAISVANTGTTSINTALKLSASGATTNYGLLVTAGNVGIGTATPTVALDVVGTTNVSTAININSVAVPTISSTTTFTNKRWTARVGSTTSSATPTINTDNYDIYKLTAQAAAITSFTSNLSGTPVDGDVLEIQITGTAARAITWGASFVSTTVTLPTTTTTTTTLTVVFQYYTTSSYGNNKWHCVNYY